MKKLPLIIFIVLTLALILTCAVWYPCFPQNTQRTNDSLPFYQGVIESKRDQRQVYGDLKEWVAKSYKSANDVIQIDDQYEKLVIKGVDIYNLPIRNTFVSNKCFHTITLEVKPGRFRYTIEISDVLTGLYDTPILRNLLMNDHPIKSDGQKYTGVALKRATEWKNLHLRYIHGMKESIIKSFEGIAIVETAEW